MPRYARFLKEIISNKRKLEDLGPVNLNAECSNILQNKLPIKRRDPGSSTVPCIIGDLHISDDLADLGARINLMSSSLFEKLGLNEPKPTKMSIKLAYRIMKFRRGIVEDVLVKVDKFIFPVDFIVMDTKGESSVPLILGRHFLATSRAVIDVCDGKLQLREILLDDPLQVVLQAEDEEELSNEDVLEQLACLLASEPSRSANHFIDIDRSGMQKLRPSLKEPPALELKELPKHLTYAYLDEAEKLPADIVVVVVLGAWWNLQYVFGLYIELRLHNCGELNLLVGLRASQGVGGQDASVKRLVQAIESVIQVFLAHHAPIEASALVGASSNVVRET
ncbi:uncharacterized protein LOC125369956 [Ricinus communis]|uniref:uncharacterized protein LOC125369956 n=1 Tax=Ricinus communis TaxID=3988 RepID=UPI00201A7FAB|nr:uncharacterized protein LOC125369956 [Ricinus communis]